MQTKKETILKNGTSGYGKMKIDWELFELGTKSLLITTRIFS